MAVVLTAALADDPVVYALVGAYGACGVWALAEFARAPQRIPAPAA